MARIGTLLIFAMSPAWAGMTYQVTGNPGVCTEIRIPRWTKPDLDVDLKWPVDWWGCQWDLRQANSTTLYAGLSCGEFGRWRMKEKYSIDLSPAGRVTRIDEAQWEAARAIDAEHIGILAGAKFGTQGMEYQGRLYPKSGSKWDGATKALPSPGKSRVAVYSHDGTVNTGSLEGPWFGRVVGTYWTDIYDIASARKLLQIHGSFRGVDPQLIQSESYWYGGRFFVQAADVDNVRRAVICDIDAAARSQGITTTDPPATPSRQRTFYQSRIFAADRPQAHITGFRDEPVYRGSSHEIESVNLIALIDVQVPGSYRLEVDLAGIQERIVAELHAGSNEVTIPFSKSKLLSVGIAGEPYRIRSVQLHRLTDDGEIEADRLIDRDVARAIGVTAAPVDYLTRAYSLDDIGAHLYVTRQNSAKLIRGIAPAPDRLEIRIGFHSDTPECRGGASLERTDPGTKTVFEGDGPGKTMITTFTGQRVTERGPYPISQIFIACGSDYIRPTDIIISASPEPPK